MKGKIAIDGISIATWSGVGGNSMKFCVVQLSFLIEIRKEWEANELDLSFGCLNVDN